VLLIRTATKIGQTLHSVQITREKHHLVSAPSFWCNQTTAETTKSSALACQKHALYHPWILAVHTWTRKQATKEQANQTHLYTKKAPHVTCTKGLYYTKLSPRSGVFRKRASPLLKTMSRILWGPNINNRVHNSPQMLPILKQNKPVHIFQSYFFRSIIISSLQLHIHFPINLFSTSYLCPPCTHFSAPPWKPNSPSKSTSLI